MLLDTLSGLGFSCDPLLSVIIGGGLEISSGFLCLSEGNFSKNAFSILGGALLGFGGLSVFMQATERTESVFFSPGKYFAGKLLSCVICPIVSVCFFILYERKNGKSLIFVWAVFIFCIFYLLNYVKIKFFSKKCGKMKRNAV
jgi:hypothetical protein